MENSNEVSNPETNASEVSQVQTAVPQQPVGDTPTPDQPLPEPIPPQRAGKKWLVPALIGLLIIALGVAGFFAYQYFQPKKEEPSPEQPTPPPTTETPSPTLDPTSDWETYTNNELGFQIKHPSEHEPSLELNDEYNRLVAFSNKNETQPVFEIRLKSLEPNTDFKDHLYLDSTINETTTVQNMPTNIYKSSTGYCDAGSCGLPYINYAVLKNSTIYNISFFGDDSLSNTELQILSTFKLTEQSGSATPTGSTCNSVNLGMSVTMPNQNWQCSVDNLDNEQKGSDGIITAKSSFFEITISSLGRGPYCNFPNKDDSCTTEPFYSNSSLSLELWKSNGENKEIFGSTNAGPWVSIKWNGMEQRALNASEKTELTTLLDSISIE